MAKSTVSVRALQQNLKRVMARVERGEVVEVTRRRRPVAQLGPAKLSRPLSSWPDLDARTRGVFGDRIITPGGLRGRQRGSSRTVTTYIDSSALVPVYVPERFSKVARSAVRTAGQLPFTALHQLEIPNAFEQLVGRELLTRDECRLIQAQLRDDVQNERLLPVSLDLDRVFTEAGELSRKYAATFLARSAGFCSSPASAPAVVGLTGSRHSLAASEQTTGHD